MPNDDSRFHTLVIAPEGDAARILGSGLSSLSQCDWVRVRAFAEAEALLAIEAFDVILMASGLEGLGPAEWGSLLRRRAPHAKQVFLDPVVAGPPVEGALRLGLHAFNRSKLRACLEQALERPLDTKGRAEHFFDGVTGLPEGLLLRQHIDQAFALARRQKGGLSVMALRLEGLEPAQGAAAMPPTRLWPTVVQRLRHLLRDSDAIGSLGQGDLALLLPGLQRPEEAVALGQRLLQGMRNFFAEHASQGHGRVSLGIAQLPASGSSGAELLNAAQQALLCAVGLGGDCLQFSDAAQGAQAMDRFRYEVDMRQGLALGQFSLHFQAQAELASGLVTGAEALLRWLHPVKGPVPPSDFIPFSEACGFIEPLSDWCLRRSLRALRSLQPRFGDLKMSVNLSARQFYDRDLAQKIQTALEDEGCAPQSLCVEVTEGSALANLEVAIATLRRLRDLGIRVALDDFGSGYASVGYLKQLPLDIVKMDKSLVDELGLRKDDEAIAELVISIAHRMGLTVIAEGIEREDQHRVLQRLGCDQGQGYLLARPQALEPFETWLEGRRQPHPVPFAKSTE